jgi:type 2 lantibiotic biosynthesis protein LanM
MGPDELRQLASWSWLSLDERRRSTPATVHSGDGAATRRRLAYWRRLGDLNSDETFAWRLARDGLEVQLFEALISAALPFEPAPESCSSALACLPTLAATLALAVRQRGQYSALDLIPADVRRQLPFLSVIAPFLEFTLVTLRRRQIPPGIIPGFLQHVAKRLCDLVDRTALLKLHVAHLQGQLTGETPESRFQQFLSEPDLLEDCIQSYPIVGRVLAETTDRCLAAVTELASRLSRDRSALIHSGLMPINAGDLVAVALGLSDSHRGNRTVALLTFASGAQLIYKPRSIAVDIQFQELLRYVDAAGFSVPLRTIKMLDRENYGYVEYVTHEPCPSIDAIRRFYHRQGGYLAILYALQGIDFHSENLIAHGEHPILIDLECLFHPFPRLRDEQQAVQVEVDRLLQRSVLYSGMLPAFVGGPEGVLEFGGLGNRPGQYFPDPVFVWRRIATDEMYMSQEPRAVPTGQNLPRFRDSLAEPVHYVDELVQGFEEMYGLLQFHRRELTTNNGAIAAFSNVPVRCLILPTSVYAGLLRDAIHPNFNRSGADRDLAFERIWTIRHRTPELTALVRAERFDLWNNDIPIFSTCPGGRDIDDSRGEHYPEIFSEACLDEAIHNLCEWNQSDRDRQVYFIRGAMAAMAIHLDPVGAHVGTSHIRDQLEERTAAMLAMPSASPDELRSAATIVGDQLLALAIRADSEATWLGLSLVNEEHWRFGTVGGNLYSGNAGIALFLGQLYRATRLGRFGEAALEAIRISQQLTILDDAHSTLGGYAGWPSMAYAFLMLSQLLDRSELRDAAVQALERVASEIAGDHRLNVVSGSAGTALVALRVHRSIGTCESLDYARSCGERLLDALPLTDDGRLIPGSPPLLLGLSHGAAGCAWAAAELYSATFDDRYAMLARALVTYERSQCVPEWQRTRDLSAFGSDSIADAIVDHEAITWCRGASGIGLARISIARHLGDSDMEREVETALWTTRKFGWRTNHSLCHGTLGNVELLLVAGEQLCRPELWDEARRWGAALLRDRQVTGRWSCGTPRSVDTPGLMTGLAGIGHALLRLADPSSTSSLLTLAL